MGDRLGIQVAVDILSSSAFFCFFPWQSGIDIVLDVIQFHLIIDGKIFSKKGLTWPGLEQSNPYKGIAGQRSSSIAKHAVHLPALFGIIRPEFFPQEIVYGHITLNTPVLVRSLKLSKVETC